MDNIKNYLPNISSKSLTKKQLKMYNQCMNQNTLSRCINMDKKTREITEDLDCINEASNRCYNIHKNSMFGSKKHKVRKFKKCRSVSKHKKTKRANRRSTGRANRRSTGRAY